MPAAPIELRLQGLHCAGCVSAVETALQRLPAVERAAVNLPTETATVWTRGAVDPSALIAAVKDAGYGAELPPQSAASQSRSAERDASLRRQRRRLIAALAVGLPVILLHMGHALVEQLALPHRAVGALQAVLTLAVIWLAAGEMIRGAFRALLARNANMDLLVSLGAGTALAGGLLGLLLQRAELISLFEAATVIVLLVALGKHFEAMARGRAATALEALAERLPRQAQRIEDGRVVAVALEEIRPGDRVRLASHALIPVDAEIARGRITVDESMLTGEALPIEKQPGDAVFGGTQIAAGEADAVATATGADSAAARLARLVSEAQTSKPPWQRFADRVAGVFVPAVLVLAAATFAGWLLLGGASWQTALERTVAVLVVACPCAMGLAIPMAVLIGTTAAARRGILVRDAATLEAAGSVQSVLLDKTGTLTLGRPQLVGIDVRAEAAERAAAESSALKIAAAAAQLSEHPLSRALVNAARVRNIEIPDATDVRETPGSGIEATVNGQRILLGRAAWLAENGVVTETPHVPAGETAVFLAIEQHPRATFRLADQLHPEAAGAIRDLRSLGIRPRILSGDQPAAVETVARILNIDDFRAALTPAEKLAEIRAAAAAAPVAMVGDGLNDAPALAAATVGIAIGAGADVAREAADICLVGSSPARIADAIRLSRRSARIMKQNLFWAFAYNALMLPAAIFTPLPAELAAAAMMLSSLTVVANSLRLRR